MDHQEGYGDHHPEQADGLLHNDYISVHPGIFRRHKHHLVQTTGQHPHYAAQQIGKGVFIGYPGHQQGNPDSKQGGPKNTGQLLRHLQQGILGKIPPDPVTCYHQPQIPPGDGPAQVAPDKKFQKGGGDDPAEHKGYGNMEMK